MKTILWATLTANGNYAQSSAENPPTPEALADFATHARAAGNFIVGRHTFAGMQDSTRIAASEQTSGANPFANLDIVVLSQTITELPGVKVVKTPQEALTYLHSKGHTTALLAGGADLHNSFLAHNLVDEVIFNIAPTLEGKGLNLLLDQHNYQFKHLRLLNFKSLTNDVIHLHYTLKPA